MFFQQFLSEKLGVKIEKIESGEYKVYGKGLGSLYANNKVFSILVIPERWLDF